MKMTKWTYPKLEEGEKLEEEYHVPKVAEEVFEQWKKPFKMTERIAHYDVKKAIKMTLERVKQDLLDLVDENKVLTAEDIYLYFEEDMTKEEND